MSKPDITLLPSKNFIESMTTFIDFIKWDIISQTIDQLHTINDVYSTQTMHNSKWYKWYKKVERADLKQYDI